VRSRNRNIPPPLPTAETEPPGADSAFGGGGAEPALEPGLDGRTSSNGHASSNGADPPRPAGPRPASSRRALKNWRVRSRLLLLIAIPTLTAVALGAIRIASSVQSALAYQRVLQLANLSSDITVLAQRLEDERDQTVYYIALPSSGPVNHPTGGGRAAALLMQNAAAPTAGPGAPAYLVVHTFQVQTDQAASVVKSELAQIGGSFPAQTQQEASTALSELNALDPLRSAATGTQLNALQVVHDYTNLIDDLLVLEDATPQGASDPTLSQDVRVLGLISHAKEDASQQRAILTEALLQQNLNRSELQALQNGQADQQTNLGEFNLTAASAQRQQFNTAGAGSTGYLSSADEQAAIALAGSSPSGSLSNDTTNADDWYGAMTHTISYQMGSVERGLGNQIIARAQSLRNGAVTAAIEWGIAILIVLGLALFFTVVVARSMVRPLRRLRAGALEVAGMRLPETVRRMSEGEGADAPLEVEPIDVDSTDEIGEVARAFDQVHREAVRLASNEAALRGNVNAMFVNLSRRSQSLVERQIRLIDDLEQGEQDSERLGNLFQMDHLATRMRRNSENLLVLAGHDVSRRWTQAVGLVDVLRAAVSEIEQYERVTLNVQPGIAVRGQAVNDVVHLLAELVENATSFSAADTPVNVAGHLLNSGGVLLDITDQGVGMGAEEMAHANWRLDNPPVVDVAVSRRMGLFVVARLAARHGIRVRLRPASMGGLTALVWLPDEVITHETSAAPGLRRFDVTTPGAAAAATIPATTAEWPEPGQSEDRSAAMEAVSAARTPRFTPLRPDLGDGDTASFTALDADGAAPAASEPAADYDSSGVDRMGLGTTEPARLPVFGAPTETLSPGLDEPRDDLALPTFRTETSQPAQHGVIVPPAVSMGEESRLPIFESVESDWFRRGRHGADRPVARAASGAVSGDWTSPADAGWEAAEVAHAPVSDGTTAVGLPKRVPKANLVPGGVGGTSPAPPAPSRSAAQTRERLASFQRGVREARASAQGGETPDGEDGDSAS
jgi:signal transduction histidine kinase